MSNQSTISFEGFRELADNNVRLFRLAWHFSKKIVIATVVASLVIALLPFLRSGVFALLINELVRTLKVAQATSRIGGLVLLVIAVNILPEFVYAIKAYIDRRSWLLLSEKFELMILKKRSEIDIAKYEEPAFNDLINKANARDLWPMLNLIDAQYLNIQNIVGVVVSSAILISIDWRLFPIIFVGSIPKFVIEARYAHEVWGLYDTRASERRRYFDSKHRLENVGDLTELKLFQNIGLFYNIVRDLLEDFNKEQKKHDQKKLVGQLLSFILYGGALAVSFGIIIFDVLRGALDIGTMTFVVSSLAQFDSALAGFFINIGGQFERSLFVTAIFKMLDTGPVIPPAANPIVLQNQKVPEIVFDKVSFAYPGTDRIVLEDFSLTIRPGEKLALVGMNGAGKTTFVKLLARFYDPTRGRILIDGKDLRDVDLESWYGELGVLFQDYASYHFLVKEVIGMGRASGALDRARVKEAARQSESDVFIEEWERGYEQMLGKQFSEGIDPSKGQLQKLALARIFYRNPKVMVLDEPTSSIDAEAEAKIFEQLETRSADRTLILISHRFSTVRKADKICVIARGKIEELGSHEELLARDGTYAHLFRLQATGYTD